MRPPLLLALALLHSPISAAAELLEPGKPIDYSKAAFYPKRWAERGHGLGSVAHVHGHPVTGDACDAAGSTLRVDVKGAQVTRDLAGRTMPVVALLG